MLMHHLQLDRYHDWREALTMPLPGTMFVFVESQPIKGSRCKVKAGSTWVLTSLKKTAKLPADAECELVMLNKRHKPSARSIRITVEHIFELIDFGKLVIKS
jgi:hypothetical protein